MTYTIDQVRQAYRAASAAGATDDAERILQVALKMAQAQAPDERDLYDPIKGMSTGEKVAANWSAGVRNTGRGLAQLLLPKSLEPATGITDESITRFRGLNDQLSESMPGGRAVQVAGEIVPTLAIPGGAVSSGLGMVPKVGAVAQGLGIGTRLLPTMMAEGGILGGLQGAMVPTTSEESALGNAAAGAAMGAAVPGALAGLGYLARPFSGALAQRQAARTVGEALDIDPRAMQRAVNASGKRIVDAPQTLAALTQNPKVAQLELASRANPQFAGSWQRFDEQAANARWQALADALGSDTSVAAAKQATDEYAQVAVPEVFKRVNAGKLADGVTDLRSAVQGRLNSAVRQADPNAQQVYGYVKQALEAGDGSPQMLWNVRKTISAWLDGAPPPGFEGTRGAKIDAPIMETRKAIDEVLNRATGGKRWSTFLEKFGEYAQAEGAQKAGQNIRNTFFDEILAAPRGATTAAGNPAVTRARLEQALTRFGKNEFGATLNWQQRNVVDQVLSDLRADEVLQRAKSAMTGKGGSQTAPLLALMKRQHVVPGGGWLAEVANAVGSFGRAKQASIVNEILQDPQAALTIVQQAEKLRRPLTSAEQSLVTAARATATAPVVAATEQ